MTIRNVYFRGETTPNQQVSIPQQTPQVVTNPIQQSKPDLISRDGANALRAYTLQNSINTTPKKEEIGTSSQYIENLKKNGLIEGKDFIVENHGKFTEVTINKNGKPVKTLEWYRENDGEVFECYKLIYQSQNNPIEGVTTCIGGDGKFRYRSKTYEKNPIKNDEINANMTPEKYMEHLKENNLKYTISYDWEDDDRYFQSFSVYNPTTDAMTKTTFARKLDCDDVMHVSKEIYDSDNELDKSVHYYHDCTEITEFKEKLNYKP